MIASTDPVKKAGVTCPPATEEMVWRLKPGAVSVPESLSFDFGERNFETEWEIIYPDLSAADLAQVKYLVTDYNLDAAFEEEFETEVETLEELPPGVDTWLEQQSGLDTTDLPIWPMMNYIWPLPGGCDRREELVQLELMLSPWSVCLVRAAYEPNELMYGEELPVGLVMTGGGQDMSWDIAGGYVTCGLLPPASLRLPQQAGLDTSQSRYLQTVWAMVRSQRIQMQDALSNLRYMAEILQRSYE